MKNRDLNTKANTASNLYENIGRLKTSIKQENTSRSLELVETIQDQLKDLVRIF